jgi:hypothetical protein
MVIKLGTIKRLMDIELENMVKKADDYDTGNFDSLAAQNRIIIELLNRIIENQTQW